MPFFLITIDTEGDNAWSKPRNITTRNAAYLSRFQSLCEAHGFKPTYLTNYEMVMCSVYVELARDVLARAAGEVGMHLHAWNTPPHKPLTEDDYRYQPYLIEYPESVMREKVDFMTNLLEETFDTKMVSHRAGRWSFDHRYARILVEHGYLVDCSVTPHISWRHHLGDPGQKGGTDYSEFPDRAYCVDLDDIGRAGGSLLMEVPMTIINDDSTSVAPSPCPGRRLNGIGRWLTRLRRAPRVHWLRPNGQNLEDMRRIIQKAADQQRPYVEFMLHSSEFMPGGSPTFQTADDIERLYDDLVILFETASRHFTGATLKEYYEIVQQNAQA